VKTLCTTHFPRFKDWKCFTTRSRELPFITSSVQHHATFVTTYITNNKMTNPINGLPAGVFPLPTQAFRWVVCILSN